MQPLCPPQTLGVPPPPQVSGSVQVPHCRTSPQPSPIGPQLAATEAQVLRPQPLELPVVEPVTVPVVLPDDVPVPAPVEVLAPLNPMPVVAPEELDVEPQLQAEMLKPARSAVRPNGKRRIT